MRPSLSIDVETNQPADMFTQMHASFALQRAFITEKTLFDANNPTPPEIRAPAAHGPRRPGAGAHRGAAQRSGGCDVVGMDSSNVDSVFIAGRAVKRRGRLLDADINDLLRKADAAAPSG